MARIFKTPFGAQGDTEQVPEAPQGDGSVSLTQGFGYDYEREYEDPAAKDIRREVMNGLFHDITEAIGDIQLSGVAKWSVDAAPYPAGAVVWHGSAAWVSTAGNNSSEPGTGADWTEFAGDAADVLRQELAANTGAAMVGTSTGDNVETALSQRVIYVGSVAELEAMSLPVGTAVYLTQEGRAGEFVVKSGTPPSDPQKGVYIVLANGNYAERKVSDVLDLRWFGANGLDDGADDTAAIVAAATMAQTLKLPVGVFGKFKFNTTVSWSGQPVAWLGERGALWRTGTALTGSSALIWDGGAAPMFLSTTVGDYFEGIQIVNRGTATDFLEKTGGQRIYMHRMSFNTGDGETKFSRSVVRSSGNFLGYSHFSTILCKGAAEIFIDIDGLGSPNSITPFTINGRCIFETGGSDLTVIKIKDETVENIKITECTFNEKLGFELTVLDTTDTPAASTVNSFIFTDNEIDYDGNSIATNRFAKLTNVNNITWDNNQASWGGIVSAGVELVNSHVVSFNGNQYTSLAGPYFNCDATSTVVSGKNFPNTSNTQGTTNNVASAGITLVPYQAVMVLNPQLTDQRSNPIFRIDVTNGSGWQVRISTASPNWVAPGLRFTVQVRNVSGGGISAGNFANGFVSGVPVTAPSGGSYVCYEFMWDGTIAQPVSGVAPTEMSST